GWVPFDREVGADSSPPALLVNARRLELTGIERTPTTPLSGRAGWGDNMPGNAVMPARSAAAPRSARISIPPTSNGMHPERDRVWLKLNPLGPATPTGIRADRFLEPRGDFFWRLARDDPYRVAEGPFGRIELRDLYAN